MYYLFLEIYHSALFDTFFRNRSKILASCLAQSSWNCADRYYTYWYMPSYIDVSPGNIIYPLSTVQCIIIGIEKAVNSVEANWGQLECM